LNLLPHQVRDRDPRAGGISQAEAKKSKADTHA
jgi:hypothetical protein